MHVWIISASAPAQHFCYVDHFQVWVVKNENQDLGYDKLYRLIKLYEPTIASALEVYIGWPRCIPQNCLMFCQFFYFNFTITHTIPPFVFFRNRLIYSIPLYLNCWGMRDHGSVTLYREKVLKSLIFKNWDQFHIFSKLWLFQGMNQNQILSKALSMTV